MNRIQMLRIWHRDGCQSTEHSRYVLRNGQTWILYIIRDPQGTRKFGHNFALMVIIDGRTDTILGSRVLDICLDREFVGQNIIEVFERHMREGCNINPEDVSDLSDPIINRDLMKGTPLPAIQKGSYGEPQVGNFMWDGYAGTVTMSTSSYSSTFAATSWRQV